MRTFLTAALALMAGCSTSLPVMELSDARPEPFKLAQYESEGAIRLAIRVGDRLFDLGRAHQAAAGRSEFERVEFPSTMIDLIAQYDTVRPQLYRTVNFLTNHPNVDETGAELAEEQLRYLAPALYPWNLLNVAVNYRSHGEEMGRELDEDYRLDDPFIFAKSPKACIVGDRTAVVLPPGRDQIDWEVELAVVMGRTAQNVPVEDALDYVFGYTVMIDLSDRGGRDRKDPLFNSDWFSGKSRNGFAPLGRYVVPAEFVEDPNNLNLRLSVNDELMQDSNTRYQVHDVQSLIAYITSIQTLEPGDIIATGTPPGVGAGRNPPVFLKSGDVIRAEVEGISSVTTPVR